ncbi:hypothetical protein BDZ89DRAFT_615713 [Hymenopellis radicata]|nr:hypothetical protein BDZ89DRAFT_615713 [Hymenopellis radicata]
MCAYANRWGASYSECAACADAFCACPGCCGVSATWASATRLGFASHGLAAATLDRRDCCYRRLEGGGNLPYRRLSDGDQVAFIPARTVRWNENLICPSPIFRTKGAKGGSTNEVINCGRTRERTRHLSREWSILWIWKIIQNTARAG